MSIFILAGEKSGDQLGEGLIKELLKADPSLRCFGVGGPLMAREPFEVILPTKEFEIMGFSEVIFSLRKIFKQFRYITDAILKKNPKAVILIDYPGFNLRLAKRLRKNGYKGKIIQYVAPTVWAWGKRRVHTLEKYYDLLLTIYPFENSYFSKQSLTTTYIGHPISQSVAGHTINKDFKKLFNIPQEAPLVALFPGSRKSEIIKNLSEQLAVANDLKAKYPSLILGISCAHESICPIVERFINEHNLTINQDIFLLPPNYRYELMENAKIALAKSGTITLELALFSVPTVVHYSVSRFNRFIATYLMRIKIPFFCIVNILGNREIFPEFIRIPPTKKRLLNSLERLLKFGEERELCQTQCHKIKELLNQKNVNQNAAEAILKEISCA